MNTLKSAGTLALLMLPLAAAAETTCYGEGAYRVCNTITQRADGSMSVRTTDSQGNSYSLDTDVDTSPSGDVTVRSRDSLGNTYEVETWTDSRGSHSRDSLGNTCTITPNGTMIGCD